MQPLVPLVFHNLPSPSFSCISFSTGENIQPNAVLQGHVRALVVSMFYAKHVQALRAWGK